MLASIKSEHASKIVIICGGFVLSTLGLLSSGCYFLSNLHLLCVFPSFSWKTKAVAICPVQVSDTENPPTRWDYFLLFSKGNFEWEADGGYCPWNVKGRLINLE
jgi:hypothetical protein